MRQQIEASGINYTVSLDDQKRAGQRYWGVVQGRLLDEMTQRPLNNLIRVESDREGLISRASLGGIAGLAGVPEWVFAHPDLATNAHDLSVTFLAEGYLPFIANLILGPIAGFPDQFTPLNLGDIGMHRQPVMIRGRVVQSDGSPAAGLTVRIVALWLQLPSATASSPADPIEVLALQPALRFPRGAAAWLRRRELIDVVGEDKTLLVPVAADTDRINCSDRVNLAIGDILAIGTEDPALTEYIAITAIDGATASDQPALITLAHPLLNAHLQQAVVRRTTPQPAGTNNPLAMEAIEGDSCVLLNSLTDLGGALVAEIGDGTQPNEYRQIFPFATNTDADGYFRLPPLSRVAQLNLRVHGGMLATDIDGFVPDYGSREHWIDVTV